MSDYHILSADNPQGKFKQFSPREKEHEYSIEHYKDKFYIVTNWNAMNFRLMETFENKTEKQNWKEVISHRKDVFLNDIDVFGIAIGGSLGSTKEEMKKNEEACPLAATCSNSLGQG